MTSFIISIATQWFIITIIASFLIARPHAASFTYVDFNATAGLVFNGHAATTSCVDSAVRADAGDVEGDADAREAETGTTGSWRERAQAQGNGDAFSEDNARAHFGSQGLREQADAPFGKDTATYTTTTSGGGYAAPRLVGAGATHVDSTHTTTDGKWIST